MNNPPAFPIPDVRTHDGTGISQGSPGMTLRDWFAGQALIAIIGSSPTEAVQDVCSGIRGGRPMAYGAYALADAMLAARETAPAVEPQMQHVAYYDEDGFDWMTGIKPRNCELYAARAGDA